MTRQRFLDLATGAAGSTVDAALSGSHNNSTTTLNLNAAPTYKNGTAVPTIASPDYIMLAILDANGHVAEVVKGTAYTTGATSITVVRAQEGTAAVSHASGAKVRNTPTPVDFSPWQKLLDLPLTSLTSWTGGGTGASWGLTGSGSVMRDAASPGNNVHTNGYGVPVPLDSLTAECEIMMNSTNNTASSRAGFLFGPAPGGAQVTLLAGVSGNTSAVDFETSGVSNPGSQALAGNIAHGTWIKLRARKTGFSVSAWVNDVFVGSADLRLSETKFRTFSFYTYAADASFRNLKLWTPGDPL